MTNYQLREIYEEGKEVMQTKYGHYCALCMKKNITPVPYHKFILNHLIELKKLK